MSANSGQKLGYVAGAAIGANLIVKIGAADLTVIEAAAATDQPIGVAEFDTASGGQCSVQVAGVAWVVAGAATTRGALITSDAAGKGIDFAAGAGTNNGVVGIAMEAAGAADELFRVLVQPHQAQG